MVEPDGITCEFDNHITTNEMARDFVVVVDLFFIYEI